MKPESLVEQVTEADMPTGIHLESVCRSLLKIIAHFNETLYTDHSLFENERRAEVFQHPDPADPASGKDTSQG